MRQKLGQHFLINKKVLEKIASALELESGDTAIEIGPGHGELTDKILQMANGKVQIIAIEKDRTLAEALKQKYAQIPNIKIIEGDARENLPPIIYQLPTENYKLAGNIPYYLTGYLFRIIGDLAQKPIRATFTIQKEVAERICAAPPKMNLLAASIQYWAEPKIIEYVSREAFLPPPEVESAILLLLPREASTKSNKEEYYGLLKIIFKQPRKTILNNLAEGTRKKRETISKMLEKLDIDPGARPAILSISDLVRIANELSLRSGT
jgi:16S rRNA (adenine1518-N6/adenine1519-N6)-dimethyltransferase